MWIIQEKFCNDEKPLIKALKDNHINCMISNTWAVCDPKKVILRGSIDFIQLFEKGNNKKFGLTLENYDCSNYYQYFTCRMLNKDYIILPWWKLKQPELIFKAFPDTERFFIRPNSGRKIFTGTTLSKKWWTKELDIIQSLPNSSIKPNDLILISSEKEILAEYRLIMIKDKLIDYSRYLGEYQRDEELAVYFWSKSIDYFPDSVYTMDIAVTKDSFKLLELNSFVSAGLYDVDYNKVVREINDYITNI